MFPLPYRYLALTGFISIASLIGMANPTVGALFAYGSLLGMFLRGYETGALKGSPKCDSLKATGQQSSQTSPGSGVIPIPNPTPGPHPMSG